MIADIIRKNNNYNLIGFIDSYKCNNQNIYGYPIVGNLESLSNIINKHNISGMVIGIGKNELRLKAYKNIVNIVPEIEFISIVHPSAIIASDVLLPEGTVLMAGAIINADAKVGKFCILNTKSSLGHDSQMSDFSSLASNATIAGNAKIGFCSSINLSASVSQGVSIGDYSIIGAASLVLKSIDDFKIAYGVPIKTIKNRIIDISKIA